MPGFPLCAWTVTRGLTVGGGGEKHIKPTYCHRIDYTACLHIICSKTIQMSIKFFRQRWTTVWAYRLEIRGLVSKAEARGNIHKTKCSFTLHTQSQLPIESLEAPSTNEFGRRQRTVRRAWPLDTG